MYVVVKWLIVAIIYMHNANANQIEKLRQLEGDFFEWRLKRLPECATTKGVHRYDDILEDIHWNSFLEEKNKTEYYLMELKQINYDSLSPESKLDYDAFNDTLQTFLLNYKWKDYYAMNPVSFLEGSHINPEFIITSTPFFTQGDFVNFIARLQGYQKQIDDAIGRMNRSIQYRHTYYNTPVLKVPEQIEKLLLVRPEDSKFYKPFVENGHNNTSIHHSIKYHLKQDALTAINEYMSSLRKLKTYMQEVYMKHTRSGPGMNSWDKGEEFYRDCLRWHLSLDMSPEEVHQKGLEEVSRISGKMNTIMRKLNHYGSVKDFFDKVKRDPRFTLNRYRDWEMEFYTYCSLNPEHPVFSKEQVLDRFKDIVQRQIQEKLPLLFKEIPNLPVAIKLKPTDGPSMYYSGPADGSRPGTFYLNLFRPKEIWSRERAIDFMLNYTAYSRSDLTNEIDRYLTWPGQACAYKIGELKIKELRAKAEKELGKRFDIKDFHLVVLKNGAMPLRLLEKLVDQWIDSVKKSPNYGSYVTCKGCCCGINMFVVIISLLILFVHTTHFYHGYICI